MKSSLAPVKPCTRSSGRPPAPASATASEIGTTEAVDLDGPLVHDALPKPPSPPMTSLKGVTSSADGISMSTGWP